MRSDLPNGTRQADLDAGVSRLDDMTGAELWELLDDVQRHKISDEFDQEVAGRWSFPDEWIAFRDRACDDLQQRGLMQP